MTMEVDVVRSTEKLAKTVHIPVRTNSPLNGSWFQITSPDGRRAEWTSAAPAAAPAGEAAALLASAAALLGTGGGGEEDGAALAAPLPPA